ncbi:23297_t:CDS:2, partial [Racocetra persica]
MTHIVGLRQTANEINSFICNNLPHSDENSDTIISKPVNIPHLALSEQEAIKYDLKKGKYTIVPELTERNNKYLKITNQGGDGVILGEENSSLLAKGSLRYTPKYAILDDEKKGIANEVGEAIFEQFPKHLRLQGLTNWEELWKLGFSDVLIEGTLNLMRRGEYPVSWFHLFGKSQVVDIEKILGGKDIRTVSAQNLTRYEYGILIQKITTIINEGGIMVEADATAFDSHLNRFPFEVMKKLDSLAFKGHPKEKEVTSILRCHYDQMQKCWMFGITEHKYPIFSMSVDNPI